MYSQNFREKVVLALANGSSIRKASADFGISTNTVRRWKENILPSTEGRRGRPESINSEALLKDVLLYPDAYQHERAERFNCSKSGIAQSLKRLNISKKNSPTS